MSPKDWEKVKEIFNRAVELDGAAQDEFLRLEIGADTKVLQQVRALLDADAENAFTETPIANLKQFWHEDEIEDFAGRRIGRYKILRELGRGGMGIVFEAVADNEDFEQIVALKLLKRGMDSTDIVRRFKQERKILASLEHPNIARLLDGGMSADGLPFFAMELVAGEPLDEFCARKNLSINERLRLFRQVCAAVSFAHSRLVVHRDLKPSNILVRADGEPKLLDFGIAKIISSEAENHPATITKFAMMTPRYASPEQARGEIVTTASDVYALGLILYELLTNRPAYEFPSKRADEIARVICEVEPIRPSAIGITRQISADSQNLSQNAADTKNQTTKSLRGDLDNIILKALRKEPNRRYGSVEQFAGDIERHLDGLPVTARPAVFSYRAAKFVSRHRVTVIAGFLIFLSLLGGIFATLNQARHAERQRILAEKRASEVRRLANAFVFKYQDEIQNLPGSIRLREMLIRDALTYLDGLAQDETEDVSLQIELAQAFMKIGDLQGQAYSANLGDTAGAIESYRKAVALIESAAQKSIDVKTRNELAATYQKFSALISRSGNATESFDLAQKAVQIGEQLAAENPADNEQRVKLAGFYLYLGDAVPVEYGHENQIKIYQKGLETIEQAFQNDSANILLMRRITALTQRIGFQYFLMAKNAEESGNSAASLQFHQDSFPFYRRSFEMSKKVIEIDPQNAISRRTLIGTKINLAQAQRETGDAAAALQTQREAFTELKQIAEADAADLEAQNDLALIFEDLALTYSKLKDFPAAFENFRQAQTLRDYLVKKDSNNIEFWRSRRNLLNRYGDTLLAKDDFEEAVKIYQTAFDQIKQAPMMQDAATQNFYAGELHEKIGNVRLANSERKNISETERRLSLENACDEYRQTVKLWQNPECWKVNFNTNRARFDFLNRKLSNCEQTLTTL